MPDPLVQGLPSPTVISYENGVARVALDFEPAQTVTAQVRSGTTVLGTGTNQGRAIIIPVSGPLAGVTHFVDLSFDPDQGPWGLPVLLVWQEISLTRATVRRDGVDLTWSTPAGSGIAYVRASIYDKADGKIRATGIFEGGGVRLAPPLPILSSDQLTVSLRGVDGVSVGPPTSTPLLTASPDVTATDYQFVGQTQYAVVATVASSMLPGGTGVIASLLRDGELVQEQQADSGGTAKLVVEQPLDRRFSWSVTAHFQAGLVDGPNGIALPVEVRDVPDVQSLVYADGAIVVKLDRAATPHATVALFVGPPSGSNWVAATTTTEDVATLTPPTLDPSHQYTVALSLDPAAGAKWGPGVALVWQQPAVSRVEASTSAVGVAWTIPDTSNFTHTTAVLYDATASVAVTEAEVTGTTARLVPGASLDPDHLYTVKLIPRRGVASAAPQTATRIVTEEPAVTRSSVSPVDGSLTIDWTASAGATTYDVALVNETGTGPHWAAAGTTFMIPAAQLPDPDVYELSVTPQATGVVGPVSSPVTVILQSPSGVAADWDGREAFVSWVPVSASGVSAYTVSVLDGTSVVASETVAASPAAVPAAFDSSKSLEVVVQAVTGTGTGPPSPRRSLFGSGLYASTTVAQPSHIVPARDAAMTAYDIVVYLPEIFSAPVTSELPGPPFALSAEASGPFPYKLTMGADTAVWRFSSEDREQVATAYSSLLKTLTQLGVTAQGWRTVQDAIARSMPQTFAESLYFAYRFDLANGSVDLLPGMVLRADFESYQYLGPDATDAGYADGFVSTNVYDFEVTSYVTPEDEWMTGFDAFLSALAGQGTSVPAPATDISGSSGGGGIVDLYYTGFRAPFVRIVYPETLLATNVSDPRPLFNVALLASEDYAALEEATANLRDGKPLPSGVEVTYLRGRTMLSACIKVWVDDIPHTVPLSTTVGNLLESMASRPPILPYQPSRGETPAGIPLSGITMTRATGAAITEHDRAYDVGSGTPVHLSWGREMAYTPSTDWLSLPLLAGDRITTRRPS